jgi:GxxExxY protein
MHARENESAVGAVVPQTSVSQRDFLTQRIIACAIEVHGALGPGLLESAYVRCLAHEFSLVGLPYLEQLPVQLTYKGLGLPNAYRIDFVVAEAVIVEVKSVERFTSAHSAQLLTYLKFMRLPTGLLINFNVVRLVQGVQRFRR